MNCTQCQDTGYIDNPGFLNPFNHGRDEPPYSEPCRAVGCTAYAREAAWEDSMEACTPPEQEPQWFFHEEMFAADHQPEYKEH